MKQFIFLVVLAGAFTLFNASISSGQTSESQVLITWEASTYTPPGLGVKRWQVKEG